MVKALYECSICKETYDTPNEAIMCESKGVSNEFMQTTPFQPGDIVVAYGERIYEVLEATPYQHTMGYKIKEIGYTNRVSEYIRESVCDCENIRNTNGMCLNKAISEDVIFLRQVADKIEKGLHDKQYF